MDAFPFACLDVTLSPRLLAHLRGESRRLGVPLTWLVAAMVADTLDPA